MLLGVVCFWLPKTYGHLLLPNVWLIPCPINKSHFIGNIKPHWGLIKTFSPTNNFVKCLFHILCEYRSTKSSLMRIRGKSLIMFMHAYLYALSYGLWNLFLPSLRKHWNTPIICTILHKANRNPITKCIESHGLVISWILCSGRSKHENLRSGPHCWIYQR